MSPSTPSALQILLVDDDRIYQFTATKIIEATKMAGGIHTCLNGLEAVQYPGQVVKQANPVPDICSRKGIYYKTCLKGKIPAGIVACIRPFSIKFYLK